MENSTPDTSAFIATASDAPAAAAKDRTGLAMIFGGVAVSVATLGFAAYLATKIDGASNRAAYENAGLDYNVRTRTNPSP